MIIILSHLYLDFDALASMVAVQKIYPEAKIIIEGSLGSYVQDFIALAKEHIPSYRLKDIDVSKVKKIILVDTSELSRSIANPDLLKQLNKAELEIIDHHPVDSPNGDNVLIETVGACTTLLVEKIMKRGLRLSNFEATLLALGIYDDTGSLLFENTTARDMRAVAYLLEQGAQLGVIAEYLRKPFTAEQVDLFQQLLDNGYIEEFERIPVYISYAECQEYFGGLALLAHRIGEIESADIWFLVVKMEKRIYLVGRARGKSFPVNKIVQVFGGWGHEKAASAVIKDGDIPSVISRLKTEILKTVQKPHLVKDIMSFPVKTVTPETTMGEANQLLLKYGHTGLPVVENNSLVGIISRRDVEKAVKHGLEHAPVKGFMTKEVITAHPEQSWEEIQELMVLHDIGRLPVVENGCLVGIVSRSDVLRLVYGSAIPTTNELVRNRSKAIKEDILDLLSQLPAKTQALLEIIREVAASLNYHAYLVGGFVRDLLLRFPTTDLDIVVEGNYFIFARKLASKLDSAKVTQHKQFGTARILLQDGTHLDIAGSRREDYDYPGALPTVEESNLKDDLFRRDFTINAMALDLNGSHYGEVIDYYGGIRDLQQGEIRFLHNLSFIEDPTRILRAIRFAGRYNFKLAKITKEAILTALSAKVFAKVSQERFTEELLLIYNEPNYQKMGAMLQEYGVLSNWFLSDFPWYYQAPAEEVRVWPLEKRWLTSLINIENKEISRILNKLTLPKQLHKLTEEYLHLREELRAKCTDLTQIDEVLFSVSPVLIEVLSCHAEFAPALKQYIIALTRMKMKITGKRLLELGFKEGPQIGNILREVRNLWLEGILKTPEEEEDYLQDLAQTMLKS
ncbi:MAG TPA: CBS domain-containing protein [Peptococcaceae bacterium]|nr:CBS domain-containing protein [Peptococcaceae bacterium]